MISKLEKKDFDRELSKRGVADSKLREELCKKIKFFPKWLEDPSQKKLNKWFEKLRTRNRDPLDLSNPQIEDCKKILLQINQEEMEKSIVELTPVEIVDSPLFDLLVQQGVDKTFARNFLDVSMMQMESFKKAEAHRIRKEILKEMLANNPELEHRAHVFENLNLVEMVHRQTDFEQKKPIDKIKIYQNKVKDFLQKVEECCENSQEHLQVKDISESLSKDDFDIDFYKNFEITIPLDEIRNKIQQRLNIDLRFRPKIEWKTSTIIERIMQISQGLMFQNCTISQGIPRPSSSSFWKDYFHFPMIKQHQNPEFKILKLGFESEAMQEEFLQEILNEGLTLESVDDPTYLYMKGVKQTKEVQEVIRRKLNPVKEDAIHQQWVRKNTISGLRKDKQESVIRKPGLRVKNQKSDETTVSIGWYFIRGLQTFEIQKENLIMNEKLLKEVKTLWSCLKESKLMNDPGEFKEALEEFEKKVCLINLGHFEVGGVYSVVSNITRSGRVNAQTLDQGTRGKLNLVTKFGIQIGLEELKKDQIQLKDANLFRPTEELNERADLYELVKVNESSSLGKSVESFEQFQRNLGNRDQHLIVTRKKFKPCYVGELLTQEINMQLLQKTGMSKSDIETLRHEMLTSFKKRYRKAVCVDSYSLDEYFIHIAEQELILKFKENYTEIKRSSRDLRDLIDHLTSYKKQLEEGEKNVFEKFIMTQECSELLEKVEDQLEKNQKVIDDPEKSREIKQLLDDFFQFWRMSCVAENKVSLARPFADIHRSVTNKYKQLQTRLWAYEYEVKNRRFDIRKPNLEQLVSVFERFITFCKTNEIQEVRKRLNRVLKRIHATREDGPLPHLKTTLLFCLTRFFDFSIKNFQIMESVDLKTFIKFFEFYKSKKEELINIFQATKRSPDKDDPQTEGANQKLVRFVDKYLGKGGVDSQSWNCMSRATNFMVYAFQIKAFELTSQDLERYLPQKSDLHSWSETDLDNLKKLLERLEKAKNDDINKSDGDLINVSNYEFNLIRSKVHRQAQEFCFANHLAYEDGIRIRSKEHVLDERSNIRIDSKKVFKKILNKDLKLSGKFEERNYINYLLSLYYLSDDNLKRLLLKNIFECGIALPFMYDDGRCFLGPLSSLSLKYKDQSSGKAESKQLNPLFHNSFKIVFFEEDGNEKKTFLEDIPNKLFFESGCQFFKKNINEKFNPTTLRVHPITNYTSEKTNSFCDLTLIFLQKQKLADFQLSTNEQLIMDISNCVVLFRGCETETTEKTRKRISKQNCKVKKNNTPKLLVEIVEDEYSLGELKENKIIEKTHSLQIVLSYFIQEPLRIYEFIKKHYDLCRDKLISLEEECKKHLDRGIQFDIFNGHLGKIWIKTNNIYNQLKQGKDNLCLQGRFYQAYSQNEEDMRSVVIESNPQRKNAFFQYAKNMIKALQLKYVLSLEEKPIMTFLKHLFSLNSSDRMSYLFYLETKLSENPIMKAHTSSVRERVQVINLFRELEQVFEVSLEHIQEAFKKSSRDKLFLEKMQKHLQVLPFTMVELFRSSYPMEIFNGELSIVPVNWLTSVLELLNDDFSDKKFTVMSVVGVQSTGKSTLLNNLFNLNLQVGNDRCTKGSSMIMMPVEYNQKKRNQPDFVLLIDSEGLGSTEVLHQMQLTGEHDSYYMRDNKMMLLNAGLSKLCVINSRKKFDAKMNEVSSIMINSIITLKECEIKPIMDLVFNEVENTGSNYAELKRGSIDIMETKFEYIKEVKQRNLVRKVKREKDYKRQQINEKIKELLQEAENNKIREKKEQYNGELALIDKEKDPRQSRLEKINFTDILRFIDNKEIHMIAPFGNQYRPDVNAYRDEILSKKFLFRENRLIHLKTIMAQIVSLNNVLLYKGYLFNARDFEQLYQKQAFMNTYFEVKNKVFQEIKSTILQKSGDRFEYLSEKKEEIRFKINQSINRHLKSGDILENQVKLNERNIKDLLADIMRSLEAFFKNSEKAEKWKQMTSPKELRKQFGQVLIAVNQEIKKYKSSNSSVDLHKVKDIIKNTLRKYKKDFQEIEENYKSQMKKVFDVYQEIGMIIQNHIQRGPFFQILNNFEYLSPNEVLSKKTMNQNYKKFVSKLSLERHQSKIQQEVEDELWPGKFISESVHGLFEFELISEPFHEFYKQLENEHDKRLSTPNVDKSFEIERSAFKLVHGLKKFEIYWESGLDRLCSSIKSAKDFAAECQVLVNQEILQFLDDADKIKQSIENKITSICVMRCQEELNQLFSNSVRNKVGFYDKNKLIYESQKELISEFTNVKSKNQRISRFLMELNKFGMDPRPRMFGIISKHIDSIKVDVRQKYASSGKIMKKVSSEISKVEKIIMSIKSFDDLVLKAAKELDIDSNQWGIDKRNQEKVFASLKEVTFIKTSLRDEVYQRLKIQNSESIKAQYQGRFSFCMERCFVCGAPCLKDAHHSDSTNQEEKKHHTPFHIPTVFTSKKIN